MFSKVSIAFVLCASVYANQATEELRQRTIPFEHESQAFSRSLMEKGDASEVSCDGEPNQYVQGSEATKNGAPPSVIGVGSCWKPGSGSKDAILRLVGDIKPDLQLWLGDQVYGDTNDPAVMKRKYDDKKQSCDFRAFMQSNIPVLATWDDHDYGDDNVVRTYPQKKETQQLFLEHFDIPETDPRHKATGPLREGVYTSELLGSKEQGRVHAIMLDNRYHHSPTFEQSGSTCDEYTTMLGVEQWKWLENELETVESEVVIIGSGLQVLPPTYRSRVGANEGSSSYRSRVYCSWYGDGVSFEKSLASLGEDEITGGLSYAERWGEMPQERERLLRLLQKSLNEGKTKSVVLTSGDVHFGEILEMEVPATEEYEAVKIPELTASGFSQNNFLRSQGNPYRVSVVGNDASNFGSISINWENNSIKLALHTEKTTDRSTYTVESFKPFGVAPNKPSTVPVAVGAGLGLVGLGVAVKVVSSKRRLNVEDESEIDEKNASLKSTVAIDRNALEL